MAISSGGTFVLPLFPLPDVTLFPHTLLPLHVFEARYRAMVVDVLARDRRIGIVQLRPGYQEHYTGRPAIYSVAGAGEIVSWERLPTGRYNLLVKGEARVRIEHERPTDTLYRVAVARRLDDVPASGEVGGTLARVRAACGRLLQALDRPADLLDPALADGDDPGVIADRIAGAVLPGGELRQRVMETLEVSRRLDMVVAAVDELVSALGGGRDR